MSAVVLTPGAAETDGARSTTRRRPRLTVAGPNESLPVRGCSGEEIGWQPVPTPAPLRLTRRGRRLVTAVSVLVFGSAVFVLGQQAYGTLTDAPRHTETVSVQVGAGQTLWSIARETNPTADPRLVIEQIADLNGLRSVADVVPGQMLVVPVG